MPQPMRVLIVEDEPLIAMDLEFELNERDMEVVGPAGHADAALELVAQEPLSIAVLDINLGAGNSFEIARALDRKQIPFIFLSGDATKLPAEFGNRTVLTKPIDYALLEKTLKAELA